MRYHRSEKGEWVAMVQTWQEHRTRILWIRKQMCKMCFEYKLNLFAVQGDKCMQESAHHPPKYVCLGWWTLVMGQEPTHLFYTHTTVDFRGGSAGKESACNAGDRCSIARSGRSPGEGNGYPLQYSGLENSRTEEPGGLQSMGSQRVGQD